MQVARFRLTQGFRIPQVVYMYNKGNVFTKGSSNKKTDRRNLYIN